MNVADNRYEMIMCEYKTPNRNKNKVLGYLSFLSVDTKKKLYTFLIQDSRRRRDDHVVFAGRN